MFGKQYHVYVGADCSDPSITSDDTCIIHCNESKQRDLTFDCGNAGHCILECEEHKCFDSGTLNAQNAHDLVVISSGTECLKRATMNLPNKGNATFYMEQQKSFKEMTVNSGTNTQNILIDCSYGNGDECKDITINAQNAQYLEVKIGSNSELEGSKSRAVINCPQNSIYQGTPCIIDVSDGGTLSFVTINTLYGIPDDVWIKTGNTVLSQVQISCNDGISNNLGNSFTKQGECWMMGRTTLEPTYYPTVNPSTFSPTLSPITLTPTKTDTTTTVAIDRTTDTNTDDMSTVLNTDNALITDIMTSPIMMNTDNMLLYDTNNNERSTFWTSDMVLYSLIGIGGAILCCIVCVFCMIRRKRKQRRKHVIHYKIGSNSSNHMVSINVDTIIMKQPGQSVLPPLSPGESNDTIENDEPEETVELNPTLSQDGEETEVLNEEHDVNDGQQFIDEYYDEIDLNNDDIHTTNGIDTDDNTDDEDTYSNTGDDSYDDTYNDTYDDKLDNSSSR